MNLKKKKATNKNFQTRRISTSKIKNSRGFEFCWPASYNWTGSTIIEIKKSGKLIMMMIIKAITIIWQYKH